MKIYLPFILGLMVSLNAIAVDLTVGDTESNVSQEISVGDTSTVGNVYIGKENDANNNRLTVYGDLQVENQLIIGNTSNTGNTLELKNGGYMTAAYILVSSGSVLSLESANSINLIGDSQLDVYGTLKVSVSEAIHSTINLMTPDAVLILLDGWSLDINWVDTPNVNDSFTLMTAQGNAIDNQSTSLIDGAIFTQDGVTYQIFSEDYQFGITILDVIPEPSTYAGLFGICVFGFVFLRRRKS